MIDQLYDKTGAAFVLDHEHDGIAYVRPMVKMIIQTSYGDDFDEDEDYEPAEYLIAMNRADLFDAPPVVSINADIAAMRAELEALKSEAFAASSKAKRELASVGGELQRAKSQLERWTEKHRVMSDLGKLLDGKVLYPLSVSENSYHKARDIPYIPATERLDLICIHSGNLKNGQPWTIKKYGRDTYGTPFKFFDTEEERDAVIASEFDAACESFRKNPDFDDTSWTTSTKLHYGTLKKWVKTHPALTIPDDIEAMKRDNDAAEIAARKAKLAAELAEMESQS